MKRISIFTIIASLVAVIVYSATGTPSTLVVKTDATGALVVSSDAPTPPYRTSVFNNTVLQTDASGNLLVVDAGGGGGGTPGGADTQVQFNNAGAFGGSANLTWDGQMAAVGSTSILIDPYTGAPIAIGDYGTPRHIVTQTITTDVYSQTGWMALILNGTTVPIGSSQHAFDVWLTVAPTSTQNYGYVYGHEVISTNLGSGNIQALYGSYTDAEHIGTGNIGLMYGYNTDLLSTGGGTITSAYGFALNSTTSYGSAGIGTLYAFHAGDISSTATNAYYQWFDSQGVYRIREDNVADTASFPQAIPAQYNPRFTKYTPGAANYERGVSQWVNNVYQIGTEVGGTGVERELQLIGREVSINVTNDSGTLAALTANNTGNIVYGINAGAYVNNASAGPGGGAGYFYAENSGAGAATSLYGVYIDSAANTGAGSITNLHGIFISHQNVGTNNYAIRTESGLVDFGDSLKLRAGMQYITAAEPACNAGNRGTTWYVAGGAGVLDTYRLCRKDAADAYAWVTLF